MTVPLEVCETLTRRRQLRVADALELAVDRNATRDELARVLAPHHEKVVRLLNRAEWRAVCNRFGLTAERREAGLTDRNARQLDEPIDVLAGLMRSWGRASATARARTVELADRRQAGRKDAQQLQPPVTRADCSAVARPCPHTTCRHHLDHARWKGAPRRDRPSARHSCSLDFVDETRGATLADVARELGVTRERVRQIERNALRELERRGVHLRVYIEPEVEGRLAELAADIAAARNTLAQLEQLSGRSREASLVATKLDEAGDDPGPSAGALGLEALQTAR